MRRTAKVAVSGPVIRSSWRQRQLHVGWSDLSEMESAASRGIEFPFTNICVGMQPETEQPLKDVQITQA